MASKHDFILDQGTTWTRTITCQKSDKTPVIFGTGATAKMQFRPFYGAPTALMTATCTVDTSTDWHTATGNIVVTVAPADSTAVNLNTLEQGTVTENGIKACGGICVYDLEVTFGSVNPGFKARLIEGHTCITPEVTLV